MTAARHIPITDTVYTIDIDSTFTASPKCLIVQQGDTVNFQNNSGSTVTIEFLPNPPGQSVSGNITIPNGSGAGFTAPNYNAAANYDIYVGTTKESGPYAIQVGTGPFYIQLYDTSAGIITNPSPIVIPVGGYLEMISSDLNYNVSNWTPADPFSPPLTSVQVGAPNNSPHQENTGDGLDYTYKLTKATPGGTTGNGGGTVKVKSA